MSASMAEGIAGVLAAHWSASTHSDRKPFVDKCDGCGEVIFSWGDPTVAGGSERLAAHQAAVLAAAGYGKLEDAWDEGAEAGLSCDSERGETFTTPNPYRRPE